MSDSKSLNHDPLSETDSILSQDFYGNGGHAPARPRRRRPSKPKPTHYKVICISMYTKDIQHLEEKVAELKRRGYTKANKSQLIRMALKQMDIDKLPPPQP
ncbi:hypothetical protein [Haliangium sp.]|uniref:hypothetical protein n=1 Tax=Haliangium sp. TaxID=2663208 RepID=UPI003D100398